MYTAFPSLRFTPARTLQFHVGAEVQGLKTKGETGTPIEEDQPYGSGNFEEIKLRGGFEFDSRGRSVGIGQAAMAKPEASEVGPKNSGVQILGSAFYSPKAMDVTESFSGVDGSVAGFLGNRKAVLGVRVGGRKLWGTYPYFESASVGGSHSLRGFDTNRFRGDSAVFGNAELRFWLGRRKKPVLPIRWALFGFYDVGRVWLEGEESDTWHQGYGGGILAEVMGVPGLAFRGSIGTSKEGKLKFYFTTGYAF
jgi:hypothetical protein